MNIYFVGKEPLLESSELCVICGEYKCGNRTGSEGDFYAVPQMSHTRGGFVSKCTVLFELSVAGECVSPSTNTCVVLKRQSNSFLSWSLAAK